MTAHFIFSISTQYFHSSLCQFRHRGVPLNICGALFGDRSRRGFGSGDYDKIGINQRLLSNSRSSCNNPLGLHSGYTGTLHANHAALFRWCDNHLTSTPLHYWTRLAEENLVIPDLKIGFLICKTRKR